MLFCLNKHWLYRIHRTCIVSREHTGWYSKSGFNTLYSASFLGQDDGSTGSCHKYTTVHMSSLALNRNKPFSLPIPKPYVDGTCVCRSHTVIHVLVCKVTEIDFF